MAPGGKRKKKRTQKKLTAEEEAANQVPKTFVLRKGGGKLIKSLVKDVRQIMLPFTAKKLKERKHNKLKDYLNVATQLSVSHFMLISSTTQGTSYLRLSKVPQGPTATYRIEKYSLISDVVNSQTNPRPPGNEYSHPPLMVLNNFSGDKSKHSTLITSLWQSVFPSINIQKIHLHHCKRVVLLDYNPETENISMRHYLITVVAKGINKPIKKLVNRKNELPNLQNYEDIATYVSNNLGGSESDAEDGPDAEIAGQDGPLQMAVRLHELGPRLELKLMKIQEGFCSGDVLYQHETDTSGTGADSSLSKRNKLIDPDDKEKEAKRIEQLAPTLPAQRNKKGPKRPKKKKEAPSGKDKRSEPTEGPLEGVGGKRSRSNSTSKGGRGKGEGGNAKRGKDGKEPPKKRFKA